MVILGERLRRWQWVALSVAFVAVVVLTLELGRPPWISLVLAFSFGTYGLLKKRAHVGPVEGLTFEGTVLAPVALAYLIWLTAVGHASSWSYGVDHVALLATTGVVTAAPLLCFAGAANRISLTSLGLLQYIAPTLQFLLGVVVFDEPMPTARAGGRGGRRPRRGLPRRSGRDQGYAVSASPSGRRAGRHSPRGPLTAVRA